MTEDRDLQRLAADLAAVTQPGPAAAEFGPVLYGDVDLHEVVRRMAADGLEDPEGPVRDVLDGGGAVGPHT